MENFLFGDDLGRKKFGGKDKLSQNTWAKVYTPSSMQQKTPMYDLQNTCALQNQKVLSASTQLAGKEEETLRRMQVSHEGRWGDAQNVYECVRQTHRTVLRCLVNAWVKASVRGAHNFHTAHNLGCIPLLLNLHVNSLDCFSLKVRMKRSN